MRPWQNTLIDETPEVILRVIGMWVYERNKQTGQGRWAHLSEMRPNGEWREGSVMAE